MSTTPTLYVHLINTAAGIYDLKSVYRPATHAERLAGTPTCGTCAHWLAKDEQTKEAPCAVLDIYVGEDVITTTTGFGCKRHEEKKP